MIVGGDAEPVRHRRGRDPEVVRADVLAPPAEICAPVGMNACDGLGDRHWIERCKHVLHERVPTCALRATRSVHAVQQLADRDKERRHRLDQLDPVRVS